MSDKELELLSNNNIIESKINKDLDLNKYDLKIINKATESYIKKISKQIGKNTLTIAKDLLVNGPGMTNFNMFRGVGKLVKEGLNDDFINKIGNIYDKDFRFRKFYDGVLNRFAQIGSRENIDAQLNSIALGIKDDNQNNVTNNIATSSNIITTQKNKVAPVSSEDINLFKASLNLISLLLNDRYTRMIKSELSSFYGSAKSRNIINSINILLSNLNKSTEQNIENIADIYNNYYNNNRTINDAITSLFYMISSAISCVKYRVKARDVDNIKIKTNNYIIDFDEFNEKNIRQFSKTNNIQNENIISKLIDYSNYFIKYKRDSEESKKEEFKKYINENDKTIKFRNFPGIYTN